MVLVKNWPYFSPLYFRKNGPGRCVSRHCRKKNAFLDQEKPEVQNVEKLGFFKRDEFMVWSKIVNFSILLF